MRGWLVLALLVCGGCRQEPVTDPGNSAPEDDDEQLSAGTFEAEVGRGMPGGYELLEGPAKFEILTSSDGVRIFVMRLASQSPENQPSQLDFVRVGASPGVGLNGVIDVADAAFGDSGTMAAMYRSPFFPGGDYRSEAGLVTVTESDERRVIGTFDVTLYTELQTGPDQWARQKTQATGAFHAVPGETGVDAPAFSPIERIEMHANAIISVPRRGVERSFPTFASIIYRETINRSQPPG